MSPSPTCVSATCGHRTHRSSVRTAVTSGTIPDRSCSGCSRSRPRSVEQAAWGTLVGGVLVQAWRSCGPGVLSWRVGRLPTVLVTMAVLLLTYRALGSLVILEPWNPHIALPWFVLFSLYAWRLALGEFKRSSGRCSSLRRSSCRPTSATCRWSAPLLSRWSATGSSTTVEGMPRPHGRRSFILTAGLAVVLWIPVLIEQFTHEPGNLTPAVRLLRRRPEHRAVRRRSCRRSVCSDPRSVCRRHGSAATRRGSSGPTRWFPGPRPDHRPGRRSWRSGSSGPAREDRDHQRSHHLDHRRLSSRAGFALSRVTGKSPEYLFYWRVPLAPVRRRVWVRRPGATSS